MYQLPTTGNPQTVAYNNCLSFVRSLVDLGVRSLFLLVTHVAAHSWRHSWAGLAEKALLGHLGAGAAVDWGHFSSFRWPLILQLARPAASHGCLGAACQGEGKSCIPFEV